MRALALVGKAGHQHDGEIGEFRPHMQRQRDPIHDGHLDIAEQQVEATVLGLDRFGRQPPILLGHHLVAFHGEGAHHEGAHRWIVFGNQDSGHQRGSTFVVCVEAAAPAAMPCPPAKLNRTRVALPGGRGS